MQTEILTKSPATAVPPELSVKAECRVARELENAGEYEAACEALTGLWSGIGERPQIEGLSAEERAEVLLRAGALSGWLGSSQQISDSQAFAKDLISESIRAFEAH